MNLAEMLTRSASRDPEHVALRLDDVEVSYRSLDDASARVAALLVDRGFSPGDRVGVMLPNVPWFAMCYYGVLRAGLTASHGIADVMLQQDQEAAHAFEVPGTPGAVLVGPFGNIASAVVMGADGIEQLLAAVIGAPGSAGQADTQSNGEPSSSALRISRVP